MEGSTHSPAFSYLKKKVESLTKNVHSTRILLFMVIHDLKYPTESIIETVKQIMRQLQSTQTQLTSVQAENESLKKNLKILLSNISSPNQSSANGSLPNFIQNEDAPKSD